MDPRYHRRVSRNQKGGFPSPRNSVSAGGLGGAVSPPVGPEQSLGRGPGGKAPEAPKISTFFYLKNTFKIVF